MANGPPADFAGLSPLLDIVAVRAEGVAHISIRSTNGLYFALDCGRDAKPMGTRMLMSVADYRRTSFDGPDRDYVDGEVVERNMGELPHAILQAELLWLLRGQGKSQGLRVLTEIRLQISATRFRVADLAVWRAGPIGERIPTAPPFLVVEIPSPEDRLVRLQPKIQEYLLYGVERVWVIDPDERRALTYAPSEPGGVLVEELRTENPQLGIRLTDLFAAID